MKIKYLGILLIFCFVAPVVTTYVLLKKQQQEVRKEVKWKMITGIDKEELVLLKFTEEEKVTQLSWKHAKEFEFNGEMYDIVDSYTEGDTTYYWLWWDHEETKLTRQLHELVAFALGSNPQNRDKENRLHHFFKTLICVEIDTLEQQVFHTLQQGITRYHEMYSARQSAPPFPPPQRS